MKIRFDRVDVLAALGLFAGVAAWAFLWAHPYPHPDLWPFLVAVRGEVDSAALGVAGRFALGALASFVYLDLRGFWFIHRDPEDELPDNFCYTRTAPICGAALFVFFPYVWRSAQFLSPEFAFLVLTALGVFFWIFGRGGRGLLSYCVAFLLFGLVVGFNPFGMIALGYVVIADSILRWQDGQIHNQREDDESAQRKKRIEMWFSVLAATIGFGFGAVLLTAFRPGIAVSFVFAERLMAWWMAWTGLVVRSVVSPMMLVLVFALLLAFVGSAIGRRIRSLGPYGLMMCRALSVVLAFATVTMLLRSVDRPERVRLQAIREYTSLVVDDARESRYLFTDGRFDDILKVEFASRGLDTVVLNTMAAPTPEAAERLKTLAPEPGDRAIFQAGGAEVFKAWARERPDRLAVSAWQLGGGIIRRYGKLNQRTHGTLIRSADETRIAADDAADARFTEWSQRIAAIAERRPSVGSLLGGTDDAVAAKFDALLWRAARIAGERAERMAASNSVTAAECDRQLMRHLDGLNASLRTQGEAVERMLPTGKLVITPREALEVSLKRADFELARRYAGEILAGDPDDSAANFALGMANLEAKEYFRASVCFEKALKKNPDEPAALNNLSIVYMKLGQNEKALGLAERAAKIHPNSAEIQRTLAEVRKSVSQ